MCSFPGWGHCGEDDPPADRDSAGLGVPTEPAPSAAFSCGTSGSTGHSHRQQGSPPWDTDGGEIGKYKLQPSLAESQVTLA